MPKKVVSFFPRRKEGEEPDGRLTSRIHVSYEDLEALFHLPLKDAAREINLCATTFKKACRSFGMEEWPFRKGQSQVPIARATAPTLQTPELHQANRAVMVSCTTAVWHEGSNARMDTSSFGPPFSSGASSSSNARPSSEPFRDSPNPFGAVLSSAAPQGLLHQAQTLLQQASMARDPRSYGAARHAGPSSPVFSSAAPQGLLQQASMAHDTRSFHGGAMPDGLPTTRPRGGGATLLGAGAPRERSCVEAVAPPRERSCVVGPPRERSCVEAVMDYLDGPLAGDFDFMFSDEEGIVVPGNRGTSLIRNRLADEEGGARPPEGTWTFHSPGNGTG